MYRLDCWLNGIIHSSYYYMSYAQAKDEFDRMRLITKYSPAVQYTITSISRILYLRDFEREMTNKYELLNGAGI